MGEIIVEAHLSGTNNSAVVQWLELYFPYEIYVESNVN
jgi:hypothetical protein